MKVKIKTYYAELKDLSPDKVYEVTGVLSDDLVTILDDVGDYLVLYLPSCAHLNSGSWEIVDA